MAGGPPTLVGTGRNILGGFCESARGAFIATARQTAFAGARATCGYGDARAPAYAAAFIRESCLAV